MMNWSRFAGKRPYCVPYALIYAVATALLGVYNSDVVWRWVNIDEEEDTVRFRQRVAFVSFWSILLGLIQIKRVLDT